MSAINNWPQSVWDNINGKAAQGNQPAQPGLINTVMGNIRILQQIFPTIVQGNDTPIPADVVNQAAGIPTAGLTKLFVTISKSFQLATVHIQDANYRMLNSQVTLAGQALALAEDALFFKGSGAALPQGVSVSPSPATDLGSGLLGIAETAGQVIPVASVTPRGGVKTWGTHTYAAVQSGIAQFAANAQAKDYAVVLDPATFADANLPLQSSAIITPASAIKALVGDGNFYMSPGLPPNTGLMAALGGEATTLYIGTGPVVQFIVQDSTNSSNYLFTATESIQFHNLDTRSLIELKFN